MKAWGLPLWDLLMGRRKPLSPAAPDLAAQPDPQARRPARRRAPALSSIALAPPAARPASVPGGQPVRRPSMEQRYDALVRTMLATHGVRVRRWRSAMSGVAWELKYDNGAVKRLIESPRPRGPMSAAIFLHEIGHHAIGFNRYKPRCLEEYHAWAFALDQMQRHGLNVTDAVRRRVHASLHYAIAKARRRGLVSLPPELEPFVPPPPKSTRAGRRRAR